MAWTDTLLDATFRGVPFHCARIGRAGQRSVAEHEFPYAAGAELEDMNLGPRRMRMQAVFFGESYEDELAQFIDALEAPGTGELVHPIHGAMTVLAQSWEDEHDADFVDGAIVNAIFIEDSVRELVFSDDSTSAKTDAIASGAEICRNTADDALGRFVDGLSSLDVPRLTVLTDAFNQAKSFVGRILTITGSAGLLLSALDPLLYPRAYASDLLASVDRAFQGLSFGGRNTTYIGAVVALTPVSAAADFDLLRVQLLPSALFVVPNVAVPSATTLADVAIVQAHAQVHCAAAIAEAAAVVLAGEADVPVLQRKDIEQLTAQTRAAVQIAIDAARVALDPEARGQASAALATLAWQVQEAARAVINLRPPLVHRASPVSGPVRLVAHAMYGTPDRATELSALNQLGRHVLIDKGDMLYAYSR
ncbi:MULTISPECIES: DNA circularization protein [unclassified Variovorax]|uniref:DNA circularization protein n=1 Tax=unclassified Variovorax TaxID=663243 RepID=UPI003F46928F